MSHHPQDLPLREQAAAVASGDLDAAELLRATLERIEQRNGPINAIVATFPQESERMLAEAPPGPLHGVPIAVKDQFRIPWRGPRDGTADEVLPPGESGIFAGCAMRARSVVAVTNMHYLAEGRPVSSRPTGRSQSVERKARGGGSSGGPACAVGARMVAGSVGADGGGSIRLPAAYCGVTGIKPTFGAVPVDGNVHGYSNLDALGPFGRDSTTPACCWKRSPRTSCRPATQCR